MGDIAFTASVKAIQSRRGSRSGYARLESGAGWATAITSDLADFIANQTSVFLATANATGQPYIQHRGGPPGFLQVLDEKTSAFADFRGNRQFISVGNLATNDRVALILVDYQHRQRMKLLGRLSLRDMPGPGRGGREMVVHVEAFDWNCPQHIPVRFEAEDVQRALDERDGRIARLEAEAAHLIAW